MYFIYCSTFISVVVLRHIYLQLERKYRLFYNVKRENEQDDRLFDMNFNNIKIEMKDASRISFLKCMFSLTEILFYITCIVTSIVVYLI